MATYKLIILTALDIRQLYKHTEIAFKTEP